MPPRKAAPCVPAMMQIVIPKNSAGKQVLDALVADKALGAKLSAPSVSYGAQNLYMRGPLEGATRGNLARVRNPMSFLELNQRATCSRRLPCCCPGDTQHAPLTAWGAQLECSAMHLPEVLVGVQSHAQWNSSQPSGER